MTHLTPEGFARLKQKLEILKEERKLLRGRRAEAYEMGGDGWHDNPEFESIEADEKRLSTDIARMENEFVTATAAEVKISGIVGVGSILELEFPDGSQRKIQIGDSHTADPAHGIVSPESPLGRAVQGATRGEKRAYLAGGKKIEVIIKSIT